MGNRVIPDAIILPKDPTGQSPPDVANDAAVASTKQQLLTLGRDSVIPVVYGGYERLAGKLYVARIYNGQLLLCLLLCEGPIQEIGTVEMNDAALPAGVTVTKYLGTSSQSVDATLAAAIPGFAEAMLGTAYIVVRVPKGLSPGFPRITAEVKGLKLADPRLNYMVLSGTLADYASTPTSSALNITGDIEFIVDGAFDFWGSGSGTNDYFFASDEAGQRRCFWFKAGTTHFWNWVDAGGTERSLNITGPGNPFANGARGQMKLTFSVANGDFKLFTSPDGVTFAQWGSTSSFGGATSIKVTTAQWRVGARAGASGIAGKLYRFRIKNGIGGPTIADFFPAPGVTPFTAATGEVWTLQGGATLVLPAAAWSDNPALALADFLINTTYGARKTVDWYSVATAADYCDQVVTGAGGSEKRALLTLALAEKRAIREWIDTLRAYVPAWVDYVGNVATIIADQLRSADHVFTAANIDSEPLPMIVKRGIRDTPNVVQIGYMRTDVKPWAMDYAEAVSGSPAVRRKARVDMPGIRRYSQAKRFAIERLNHYNLEDLEAQVPVFEDGLKVLLGDRATVTDDIGLSAKEMRVTAREDRGHGRWLVGMREYDPAAYSSNVETTPTSPDTGLPDPRVVAAPTALVITETVYLEKNIAADSLSRGLIYQSRFDCTVTPPVHAYSFQYRWELYDGALKLREELTTAAAWSTPTVQQGKTYAVNVYTRNSLGFESSALINTQAAQGKLLAPGPVPSITRAFEIGGEVLLEWSPAIDIDVEHYEWRYTPNQTGGGSWATAILIDRVDALRARFLGLPVGTHRFYVRALDSVGNYSTSDTTIDITVTSDADAFLQDREFTSPTLVNMVAFPMVEGVWKKRWASSVAADAWNSVLPNPVNSGGAAAVISYHASATQSFTGEPWDFGVPVTGDFTLTAPKTVISGSVSDYIETSDNGSAWTRRAGVSWKGTTRFVRPAIEALTSSTFRLEASPIISLAAQTKAESAEITSLSSGGYLVQMTGTYVAARDLQVTPVNTTASRNAVVDRILLYPQTGLTLFFSISAAGYVYQKISTSGRTILGGGSPDYLEFDVWIDGANPYTGTGRSPGGVDLEFTDTTLARASGANYQDQNGHQGAIPTYTMDVLARGLWYARKINLSFFAGKIVNVVSLVGETDGVGAHKVVWRNIRFTDGAGTTRATVWSSGEPSVNTTLYSANATNIRCGPANSFQVYVFTSNTAAQVASDARWTFRGF